MSKYKVRFHLARGDHFMHWQIKNTETGDTIYVDPDKHSLYLEGCELVNRVSTAKKIYNGADKTVCAWVECQRYFIDEHSEDSCTDYHVSYNPRKLPHWRDMITGEIIDGKCFRGLYTVGRGLYY